MIKENIVKNESLNLSTSQSKSFLNKQTNYQPVTMLRHSTHNYEQNRKFTSHNNIKTLKYGRSSSLPLKIMIRDTTSNTSNTASTVSTSQSWTNNSYSSDKLNSLNCFINYQFSFSERFLDLIDFNNPGSIISLATTSSAFNYNRNDLNLKLYKFCRDKAKYDNSNKNSTLNEQSDDIKSVSSIEDILLGEKPLNGLKESDELNIQNLNLENEKIQQIKKKLETNCELNQVQNNQTIKENQKSDNQVELDLESTDIDNNCSNDQILDENLNESKSDLEVSIDEIICHNTTLSNLPVIDEETKQDEESVTSILSSEELKFDSETISEYDQELDSSESEVEDEDSLFRNLIPKKSCLRKKNIPIDSSSCVNSPLSDFSSGFIVSSPLSPSSDTNLSLVSVSSNCSESTPFKKRVSFADSFNQELFTVRVMTESSNCPPKLTSKIVHYFLNREFNYQNENSLNNYNLFGLNRNNSLANDLNYMQRDTIFSSTRKYDNHGINSLNYSAKFSKPSGSLAVYTLNFTQPASDYHNFRKRLDHNLISLENVILDGFQITGTVKVKNISYHKNVFIRYSHNNWSSYLDYQAQFVPGDYFNANSSLYSSKNYSLSTAFYEHFNNTSQPIHKDHDTFRFDFQLPKTVDETNLNQFNNENATASIQFCICYRSGIGNEAKEFWDNNDGKNYHILQYSIDLERLKTQNNPKYNKSKSTKSNRYKSQNGFKDDKSICNHNGITYLVQDNNAVYY